MDEELTNCVKGSSDPSHFIMKLNVRKSRNRHRTTPKLHDEFLDRLEIDWKFKFSRSMSDPPLSDIDFKNKMAWVWTTLN